MPAKEERTRTTVLVDTKLWKRFLMFVFEKHGSAKKASVEVEMAIKEYLDNHEKR